MLLMIGYYWTQFRANAHGITGGIWIDRNAPARLTWTRTISYKENHFLFLAHGCNSSYLQVQRFPGQLWRRLVDPQNSNKQSVQMANYKERQYCFGLLLLVTVEWTPVKLSFLKDLLASKCYCLCLIYHAEDFWNLRSVETRGKE
jgi:hypothetical protein